MLLLIVWPCHSPPCAQVGEPLEVAVAREVEEESGVVVDLRTVAYNSSQPWPFPRSLMLAFYARAAPLARQRRQRESGGASPPPLTPSQTVDLNVGGACSTHQILSSLPAAYPCVSAS